MQEYVRESFSVTPGWTIFSSSQNSVVAVSEQDQVIVHDQIQCQILKLCGKPRPIEDLLRQLQGVYQQRDITSAINDLIERRIIMTTGFYGNEATSAAFWASVGTPLKPQALELCVHGSIPRQPLQNALESYGILVKNSDCKLIAVDDYLAPDLCRYETYPTSFLLTKPIGASIWIGPVLEAASKPCLTCLRLWLTHHRVPQSRSIAATPSTLTMAAGLISTTAAIWCSLGRHPRLENRIVTFDIRSLQTQEHLLRPHPACQHCTSKTVSLTQLRDLVSPICGIVSFVKVTDKSAGGLFHATAQFVQPSGVENLLVPPHSSIGKGLTTFDAEMAALGEAVERYSIAWHGNELVRIAEVTEANVPLLNSLFQFSERQYREREHWNQMHEERQWVPEHWFNSGPISWCDAHSLADSSVTQIPAAYCFLNYHLRGKPRIYYGDTNGCAAGPSLEAATLSALLELIERDAIAIWWYNRLRRPAIDLHSFHHEGINAIHDALKKVGRMPYVLDITTDTDVPSFVAVIPRQDGGNPCFGAAAHVSASTAAFRALSEAVQVWFWTGVQGGTPALRNFLDITVVDNTSYLSPARMESAKPDSKLTVNESIRSIVLRLSSLDIDCFRLDCTRPETRVAVVRVVAPKLRHFWARFGAGRLYDVPLRMGWRHAPTQEQDLNPIPCMI